MDRTRKKMDGVGRGNGHSVAGGHISGHHDLVNCFCQVGSVNHSFREGMFLTQVSQPREVNMLRDCAVLQGFFGWEDLEVGSAAFEHHEVIE